MRRRTRPPPPTGEASLAEDGPQLLHFAANGLILSSSERSRVAGKRQLDFAALPVSAGQLAVNPTEDPRIGRRSRRLGARSDFQFQVPLLRAISERVGARL